MADVLTVVAKIRAAKGKGDALAALLKEQVAVVRKAEPGCLVYRPHRSSKDPDLFIFYEQYKDDAAFDLHRKAPHLAAYRERRRRKASRRAPPRSKSTAPSPTEAGERGAHARPPRGGDRRPPARLGRSRGRERGAAAVEARWSRCHAHHAAAADPGTDRCAGGRRRHHRLYRILRAQRPAPGPAAAAAGRGGDRARRARGHHAARAGARRAARAPQRAAAVLLPSARGQDGHRRPRAVADEGEAAPHAVRRRPGLSRSADAGQLPGQARLARQQVPERLPDQLVRRSAAQHRSAHDPARLSGSPGAGPGRLHARRPRVLEQLSVRRHRDPEQLDPGGARSLEAGRRRALSRLPAERGPRPGALARPRDRAALDPDARHPQPALDDLTHGGPGPARAVRPPGAGALGRRAGGAGPGRPAVFRDAGHRPVVLQSGGRRRTPAPSPTTSIPTTARTTRSCSRSSSA